MSKKKSDPIAELFHFYYDLVKPLYATISADNKLPQEVLFEINASFDHLSRIWQYGDDRSEAAKKAESHLKRACLDIFKIKVKLARDQYDEICKIDISFIDNGEYSNGVHRLFQTIKSEAAMARQSEGNPSADAFDLWLPVYNKCIEFENKYFNHRALDWARKRSRFFTWKSSIVALLISYLAGSIKPIDKIWATIVSILQPILSSLFAKS